MRNTLTPAEQQEVAAFGCTIAQMREAVESCSNFRFRDPATCATAILCSAQESIKGDDVDWLARDEARQAINRAKWVINTYCIGIKEVAA